MQNLPDRQRLTMSKLVSRARRAGEDKMVPITTKLPGTPTTKPAQSIPFVTRKQVSEMYMAACVCAHLLADDIITNVQRCRTASAHEQKKCENVQYIRVQAQCTNVNVIVINCPCTCRASMLVMRATSASEKSRQTLCYVCASVLEHCTLL